MSTDVAIYTSPPEDLINLLRTHHLPHALPLLRRLRFTRFPGGITEHARILFASNTELARDTAADTPFAAAYLDFSRGPETEIWLYSSLERRPDALASAASLKRGVNEDDEEKREEEAAWCARRVLQEVRRQRDAYSAERRALSTILAGTLSETLRLALVNQGVIFAQVDVYDKWVFRLDALPDVDVQKPLAEDMLWDRFRREDIPLMLSRTHIQRKEYVEFLFIIIIIFHVHRHEANRPPCNFVGERLFCSRAWLSTAGMAGR